MWRVLRNSMIRTSENVGFIVKNNKRFAGHSKWANIKHTKAAIDGERAMLFSKLIRQMKVAITEGSFNPSDNVRLSQLIEQAKKKNMPAATINSVLEKAAKSTTKLQVSTVNLRGPGGCIIVVELHTDNLKGLKMLLQNIFKKHNTTQVDQSSQHVFHHKGFVVTELLGNLDTATEDAIAVGAEDVEEIIENGSKCFQFTCEPNVLAKVVNQLANLKYNIVNSEDKFIPYIFANLNEAELDRASALYAKLEAIDEVVRVHDNIA